MSAWLIVMYRPVTDLRLRLQTRYRNEAISDSGFLEQSLWAYLEAAWWLDRLLKIKLRYALAGWLDDRQSSQDRTPNPEHWFRLELEYRF